MDLEKGENLIYEVVGALIYDQFHPNLYFTGSQGIGCLNRSINWYVG